VRDASRAAAATAVSVILPLYNEAGLVDRTFTAVRAYAREHREFEFLFVDDGSGDGTPDRIEALLEEHGAGRPERIRLIRSPDNGGKGRAVHLGVEHAGGDLVLFMDGDLAYGLDHLPLLVDALAMHEVVIGSRSLVSRKERNTRPLRRLLGEAFNRLARLVLFLPYRDTQAGLKGFRVEAARAIFARQRIFDFSFDVELIYIARRLGFSIAEVPARVSDEHSYKVSKVNLVRDPARMLLRLFQIRIQGLLGRYG